MAVVYYERIFATLSIAYNPRHHGFGVQLAMGKLIPDSNVNGALSSLTYSILSAIIIHMNDFIKDMLERAGRTAAQAALAVIGSGTIGVLDVDWINILSVSLMAAIVSILWSIANSGDTDSTLSPASSITTSTAKHAKEK